jgi:hypothetical protein
MLHFQTLRKIQCSGFFSYKQDNTSELVEALADLKPDCVLKVQRDADDSEIKRWKEAGLLREKIAKEQKEERKLIKAFIAFSEPLPGLPNKSREKIVDDLAKRLNEPSRDFHMVTILEGSGFCWLMAKMVTKDFHKLGQFVHEVAKDLGPLGVSSSTFFVTREEDGIEGDSISEEALREYEPGNRSVAAFIPDLYKPSTANPANLDKRAIEGFVLEKILPHLKKDNDSQLDRDDIVALKQFLIGVIKDDRDSAFVALYPRIINAERTLREPVLDLAKRCSENASGLIAELRKADQKAEKNLSRLTLLDALRSARWILSQFFPDDAWVKEKLKDADLQSIVVQRNVVAHGKDIQLQSDWLSLADNMLSLFLLRRGILDHYSRIPKQADEQNPPCNL